MPDALWTVSEAAAFLRLPKARVYALIRRDVLRGIHIGRQVRISRSVLERFCNDGGAPLSDTQGGANAVSP
jgi:excisionase family DNA binding protein